MKPRKLNTKQSELLFTIFKFRYISTENLSRQRNVTSSTAYSALETLHKNGYIGKKHNKSYRLKNKHARYYLTPYGVKTVQGLYSDIHKDALKSRLRDKNKTSDFIDMQLAIHRAYIDVRKTYGDKAIIKTGAELAAVEGIIKPLPSLYVYPPKGYHYFIELTDGQHLFIVKKRIRKYIDHYEDNEWDWDGYPNVRIVRKAKGERKKLEAYVEEKMDDYYLDEDDFTIEIAQRAIVVPRPPPIK